MYKNKINYKSQKFTKCVTIQWAVNATIIYILGQLHGFKSVNSNVQYNQQTDTNKLSIIGLDNAILVYFNVMSRNVVSHKPIEMSKFGSNILFAYQLTIVYTLQ